MSDYRFVTKRIPRFEGKSLALGKPAYMADLIEDGALAVKTVHSPYPAATVLSIDASKAEKVPGFVRLFTWEDTPVITNFGWNYTPFERHILSRTARFQGEVVALVAAETPEAAAKAAGLLKIEWRINAPVMDYHDAIDNEAVVHFDQLDEIYVQDFLKEDYFPERNIVHKSERRYGDLEKAKSECVHITHAKVYTPQQIHMQFETHRCYTYFDERGFLVIKAPTQAADALQEDVARSLGIDRRKLRVIKTQVGGGFGGKNIFSPYCWCALVSHLTGRAAYLMLSRREAMMSIGSRHEYELEATAGVDKDGILRFIEGTGIQNAGAYSELSEDIMETGIRNSYPMFPRVDALHLDQYSVFTNKLGGCAFRGFGATQNCFLLNAVFRHLTDEAGLDITKFYIDNIAKTGDSHPVMNGWREGQPTYVTSCQLEACIKKAQEMIGWNETRNKTVPEGRIVRGTGLGIAAHASGVPLVDRGNVIISFNPDGSFAVFTGHADIGTGSNTVMLQIVAEVLEVSIDHLHLIKDDTACTPFDPGTYASSNTYRCGGAAKAAAEKMKALLWKSVRKSAGLPEDAPLEFKDEVFYTSDGKRLFDLIEFADRWGFYGEGGGDPLTVGGSFEDTFAPSPYVASCAQVEVNKDTGEVKLLRMTSAIDCGRVLNPTNAEVQARGGLTQSIGMTFSEEILYSSATGRITNASMQSYKIPSQMDIPDLEICFVDSEEPTGPYGAKSLGEIATGSPAPAIADALFNALGIHFDVLPITPERVLKAIREKEAEDEY